VPKFILKLLRRAVYLLYKRVETLNVSFSKMGQKCFFENSDFPRVSHIESSSADIKQELLSILQHHQIPNFQDISVEQKRLTTDDKWKTFFLYGYGYKNDKNCKKCPKTTEIIQSIPGLQTAMFSILYPGKHIPPHRGPYNGVLRYHLGLLVPDQKNKPCGIRVGEEVGYWAEGKSLIFDDTFEHETWNKSDEIRVVLFIDFIRPLPWLIAKINNGMLFLMRRTSFVQNGIKNIEAWNRKFDEPEPTKR